MGEGSYRGMPLGVPQNAFSPGTRMLRGPGKHDSTAKVALLAKHIGARFEHQSPGPLHLIFYKAPLQSTEVMR